MNSSPTKHLCTSFRKIDLDFLLPRVKLIRPTVLNRKGTCCAEQAYRKGGQKAEAVVTLVSEEITSGVWGFSHARFGGPGEGTPIAEAQA